MTIEATTIEFTYTGDGSTTEFPFPAKFQDNSDILVGVDGVEIFTGFSVTGEGDDSGGTVTFNTAPAVGALIMLIQKPPITQLTSYVSGGKVLESTLESALDKLTRIAQYLDRVDNRTIRLGDFDTSTLGELPDVEDRAGNYVGFDTDGDVVVFAPPTVTVAGEHIYNTHAALQAATITGAGTSVLWVGLLGRLVQGDHAFMIAKYSAVEPTTHAGYLESADGAFWIFCPSAITKSMFVDGPTAARAAYVLDLPYELKAGEQSYLECNPTSGDDLRAMSKWVARNVIGVEGRYVLTDGTEFWLQIADGSHAVSTMIDLNGPCFLDIRASAAPDVTEVTSVSFSTVSGTLREATIGCSGMALPASYVAGDPIGLQMMHGDGGCKALSGGHIIHALAGDRLSFTVRFFADALPAAVTTISTITDPDNGQPRSRVVLPKARLRCNTDGWGGGNSEGFLNQWGGAVCNIRDVGFAIANPASAHDLVFCRGGGTHLWLIQYVVLAGADSNAFVLRQYGPSDIHANLSLLGCAGIGSSLWTGTEDSKFQLVRCSVHGGTDLLFSTGARAALTVSQTFAGASAIGVYLGGVGAAASVKTCSFFMNTIGCLAAIGNALLENTVTFDAGNLGGTTTCLQWQEGGFIFKAPVITGYTNEGVGPPNTSYRGGGWYKQALRALTQYGESVTIANATRTKCTLTGAGGRIEIICSTAVSRWILGAVDLTPGTLLQSMAAGGDITVVSGGAAAAVGSSAGKLTVQVYDTGSGVYALNLVNDLGANATVQVLTAGNLALSGAFAAF